jgi:hypothetical protein
MKQLDEHVEGGVDFDRRCEAVGEMDRDGTLAGSWWLYNAPAQATGLVAVRGFGCVSGWRTVLVNVFIRPSSVPRKVDLVRLATIGLSDFCLDDQEPQVRFPIFQHMVGRGLLECMVSGSESTAAALTDFVPEQRELVDAFNAVRYARPSNT